ncbi:MAG: hypothetical protein AAF607_10170 [Pseudomonadota bacterium]
MTDVKRTRGRPRKNPEAPILENEVKPEPRRRRKPGATGGFKMKLQAEQRPGYVRYWGNDDGNGRIEHLAGDLAYDFVTEGNKDGSRVRQRVGTQANGEPLYAYLMETPEEDYALGEQEREARAREIDDVLRQRKPVEGIDQDKVYADQRKITG